MTGERLPRLVVLNPWERRIGPNRYLVELLLHAPDLAARTLVVLDRPGDAEAEYRAMGCQVAIWPELIPIRPPGTAQVGRGVAANSVGALQLARRLRSAQAEVVVTNTETLLVGGFACLLLGIPHLAVVHALLFADPDGHPRRLVRLYLALLARSSWTLVAVSAAVAKALVEAGVPSSKVATVPNPVAVPASAVDSRPLPQLSGHHPVLVSAGRISATKGYDLLVEALATVAVRYPKVICLVAGAVGSPAGLEDTHAFYEQLLARVDDLGLAANIRFLGDVDDLTPFLRLADVYVQSSRTESFGRVLAEALLLGVPVAAFAVGGIPESVGPGAVLAVPGDAGGLACAILGLLDDPGRAATLGSAGRDHVSRHFAAGQVAGSAKELVIAASARRPPA